MSRSGSSSPASFTPHPSLQNEVPPPNTWDLLTRTKDQRVGSPTCGRPETLLATSKRRKINWFGHICQHNSLAKIMLWGTIEGGRKRRTPRKYWLVNIKDWDERRHTLPEGRI